MATQAGRTLPATEVKNRFGRVLNEVSHTGKPIVVKRGSKVVAVILSIEVFERLRPGVRRARDRRALAIAAFGMWRERSDIDDKWLAYGRTRWQSAWNQ